MIYLRQKHEREMKLHIIGQNSIILMTNREIRSTEILGSQGTVNPAKNQEGINTVVTLNTREWILILMRTT